MAEESADNRMVESFGATFAPKSSSLALFGGCQASSSSYVDTLADGEGSLHDGRSGGSGGGQLLQRAATVACSSSPCETALCRKPGCGWGDRFANAGLQECTTMAMPTLSGTFANSSYAPPPGDGPGSMPQVCSSGSESLVGSSATIAAGNRTVPPWRLMTPEEAAQSNRPPRAAAVAVAATAVATASTTPWPNLCQHSAFTGGAAAIAGWLPVPSAGSNIEAWLASLGLSQYTRVVATQYDNVEQIIQLYRSSITEFFEDCGIEDKSHRNTFVAAVCGSSCPPINLNDL